LPCAQSSNTEPWRHRTTSTGRASKGIAKLLERGGLTLIAEPESFLVGKDNALQPGEEDRAQGWGENLAAKAMAAAARTN